MSTSTYALQGLHCNACKRRVAKKLEPLADSVSLKIDPMQVVLTKLSAVFKLPTSTVAIVEGPGMVAMALLMLLIAWR